MFKSTLAAMAAVFALSTLSSTTMAVKGDPHVSLTTSAGNIEPELDRQKAPVPIQDLVDYANNGFYNNTTSHRVAPGFMIQDGDFTEQIQQKEPNLSIKNEVNDGLHNTRGTITVVRTADKDSTTSQFFISIVNNTSLDRSQHDFGYVVFDKVVKGTDVADKIPQVPTHGVDPYQDVPSRPVVTLSAEVLPQ